jgi:hypothetical protein
MSVTAPDYEVEMEMEVEEDECNNCGCACDAENGRVVDTDHNKTDDVYCTICWSLVSGDWLRDFHKDDPAMIHGWAHRKEAVAAST